MEPPTLPPSTRSQSAQGHDGKVPGVILVFSSGVPSARVIALTSGALELGRGESDAGAIDDGRVSRRHARVTLESGHCVVTDLASQNGTVVDGLPIAAHSATRVRRIIRVGDSLLVPCADIRPLERAGVDTSDGFVRGPAMQAVLEEAGRAAHSGGVLHVCGESGTGKEGIAQAFHRGRGRGGGFVAVNCAAIPHALAERLLFGARRGAYSGADADTIGYMQEADGGTLFLDEVVELEAQVQAKLLRVLESREVLPLGASKARTVDFALCSAASKDLRALVASGGLREDLYFRIGRPAVTLPALRDRPEEIPALIAHELARCSPASVAHVSLVEQCLLRSWPGNVRELLAEIRAAAQAAAADGNRITAQHLAPTAGSAFAGSARAGAAQREPSSVPPSHGPHHRMPQLDAAWHQRIEDALRANAGKVAAAARALGLHRTQLRRLIARHKIAVDLSSDD